MSLPFCKLVGYELSYIASGEKKATSDLVRDSAIQGLLFVPGKNCLITKFVSNVNSKHTESLGARSVLHDW